MTDPTPDHSAICAEILRLAIAAGEVVMEVYESDNLGARAKEDASPVTLADERADALIGAGLKAAFPHIPVVTEEDADSHREISGDRFFIVDPLDGTKEFIKRRGEFTVNIALVVDGAPVFGVVHAPALGRTFWTAAEGGAMASAEGVEAHSIRVAEADNAALRVVASKSHRDAATDAYIARYDVADSVSAGSSLKFCLVAAGEADLYPRLGRTMEWDTAAGHAVLSAAGGLVERFDGDGPLRYGKPGYENPFFIARAPGAIVRPEPISAASDS